MDRTRLRSTASPGITVMLAGAALVLIGSRPENFLDRRGWVAVCAGSLILLAFFALRYRASKKVLFTREAHASVQPPGQIGGGLAAPDYHFRVIADSAPVMIWISGLDKKCTWFNRLWLDFTGRTLEQEMGDGWAAGVHAEDLERCLATYVGAFDRREPFEMEYRLRRHDGQWRWIVDHGVPFTEPDGTFLGYVGSCIDIHDRKQTEEALKTTNKALQEYANIVDLAAVMVRDTEFRVTGWTSGAQALYGFTASQALGTFAWDLLCTEFPEPFEEIQTKLFATGQWQGQLRQKASDGRDIVVNSLWALHRNKEGEPLAILTVNVDVTAHKVLEEQIRLRADELEAFMDATPAFVWIAHDAGCKVITGNRAANQLLGIQPGTNASQTPWGTPAIPVKHFKMDGTEYRPEELPMQRAAAAGETVENIEFELGLADGRRVPVSGNAAPLFDAAGRVRGCIGVFLDATEKRHAEDRFRLAVEASPSGMILSNDHGKIVLVNSETERLFGYRREEMMGQPIESLVPRQIRDDHRTYRKGFYADPRARRMGEGRDLYAVRKDGTEFPVEIALNPIQTAEGRLVLSAIVDITERKRLERERLESLANERLLDTEKALREAEAELARVVRALTVGELATSIAHEINQPLAAVVTNAHACLRWLARETPNLAEARESLALIIRDGNRAGEVIHRIRELLKKESPSPASLDMSELIRETHAFASADLEKRRISARLELSADVPLVRGDRILLQQVLLNLIMNSADAMASSGGPRELLLTSTRNGDGGVLVAVRDTGVGIDPSNVNRMFDAFFTTKNDGIGLGLSISRSIIESHGGRIWAEPNNGPGVTVQFHLPAGEQENLS